MYSQVVNYCKENFITYKENEPMSRHTTFRIGGNADLFVCVKNKSELCAIVKLVKELKLPLFVLGNGSNLLVSDNGIEGVVLSLEELREITLKDGIITAGAGAQLSKVCTFAADNDLSGLEFAFGIPGSVGGALYMNAGAYGGEMKDVVVSANCIDKDGNDFVITAKEMLLGYRTSVFKNNSYIIVSADMALNEGKSEEIKLAMNGFLSRRKEKQPLEYASAGSTFKRPEGYFAGALIEKNGLKGFSVGGACVSEKHAGFVINKGGATAKEVRELIERVSDIVYKNNGVVLEPEVIFVGRKN